MESSPVVESVNILVLHNYVKCKKKKKTAKKDSKKIYNNFCIKC